MHVMTLRVLVPLQEDFSTTSLSLVSGQEPTFLLPSATPSEQTDSVKQQHLLTLSEERSFWASKYGHSHANLASELVIDFKTASSNENDKRK